MSISSIAEMLNRQAEKLLRSSGSLSSNLNEALNELLVWPFHANEGFVGNSEEKGFGSVIHTSPILEPRQPFIVPADNVACVIDNIETLNLEQLRGSYDRIARAKRIKKATPVGIGDVPYTTTTLGIIFSLDSEVPLETLAEELERLNAQYLDGEWPDIVVVLSKGIIGYSIQFPGENIINAYLPPVEGALKSYTPPIYIILVINPLGKFTLHKMCSLIIAHLLIFSPGTNLPNWEQMTVSIPKKALIITGYQYNLTGKLVPVPRQFYKDRYLQPRPFLIEDQKGAVLATIGFLPWQDGGVVILRGKLPLDGLLPFLGKKIIDRGGVIKRDELQISYVLPMTQTDFMLLLQRIHNQTNMQVKADDSKFVIEKLCDEGSSSPFIARLYMGLLRLRDVVFPAPPERDTFDRPFKFVIETLLSVRGTSKTIIELVTGHLAQVTEGEIAEMRGHSISIKQSIDRELRKEVEAFLNGSVRLLKQGMQDLTKVLGADIGFLFNKEKTFQSSLEQLAQIEPVLAEYLKETRKWSERLINCRNDIEHGSWVLPKIRYTAIDGKVIANEPDISGVKVTQFVEFITDRLTCFVEELTAYCLEGLMPEEIAITEIPVNERDIEIPQRFQLTFALGGMPMWDLKYDDRVFESK